jgi:MFS family permease
VALVDLVLKLTEQATLAALISLAMSLPVFVLTPWAGAVADRRDRRQLMIWMDLVRAGAALLPLLATTPARLLFAYVGVSIISICSAYFEPAADAALPNLVAPEDLGRANVLFGSAWGTTMALGAMLSGMVTAYRGQTTAFVIDSLSFVVSALLIYGIRAPLTQQSGAYPVRTTLADSMRQTADYARTQPQVLALLMVKLVSGLGGGLISLLAVFGETTFQRGAQGVSLMLIARGTGATLGPLLINATVRLGQQCRAIAPALALFGLGYIGLSLSPNIMVAMVAVVLSHIGATVMWQATAYTLQTVVPDHLRGRVFAADNGVWTLSYSLSSLTAGVLADRYGIRTAALGFGLFAVFSALLWGVSTYRLWRNGSAPPGEKAR